MYDWVLEVLELLGKLGGGGLPILWESGEFCLLIRVRTVHTLNALEFSLFQGLARPCKYLDLVKKRALQTALKGP